VKEKVAFIVSDPIPKVTLKEHLEQNGPLKQSEIQLLISVVVEFAIFWYNMGLRNIKISSTNIGYTDGEWKVFNFCLGEDVQKLEPKSIAPENRN
jgi:hypothetical protein